MKLQSTLTVLAAAVALFSQTAFAQEKTRAEVKAETASANKAGKLMPAGEVEPKAPTTKSDVSRATVKSETAAANKAGQTMKAGVTPPPVANTKSDVSRAAVKSETASANKAGQTMPAGDAATPGMAPKK